MQLTPMKMFDNRTREKVSFKAILDFMSVSKKERKDICSLLN